MTIEPSEVKCFYIIAINVANDIYSLFWLALAVGVLVAIAIIALIFWTMKRQTQ